MDGPFAIRSSPSPDLDPVSSSVQSELAQIWECDTLNKAAEYILAHDDNPITLSNFVNGDFTIPPSSLASPIVSYKPGTGTVLCHIPRTQPDDVEAAICSARAAFPAWSATLPAERSLYLRRVSEMLRENRELFAVWESIDQGKTLQRARMEVDRAAKNFEWV